MSSFFSSTFLSTLLKTHNLPPQTTLHIHGSSSFTSTAKLTTPDNGPIYFLKSVPSSYPNASEMLLGEYTSLSTISKAVPSFCPTPIAHGTIENTTYLLTAFLNLNGRGGSTPEAQRGLAQQLAKLHHTPSPTGRFGFDVPTFCGATKQDNTYHEDWASFFSNARLAGVMDEIKRTQSGSMVAEIDRAVRAVREKVVGRLLGRMDLLGGGRAVLVHGDLWGGNCGWIRDEEAPGGTRGVVFDPSASYSVSEFEIGIMRMFGGFNSAFWEEYHKLVPKAEPVEEFEDRIKLYEAYHYLNHFALFGGSYGDGAVDILERLARKYGGDNA